ncbi:MAG: hypothetical protein KGI98_16215 [Euryarchaeota archaeon]|nr:hypothetical protein [Euryarchaeota archaeon]
MSSPDLGYAGAGREALEGDAERVLIEVQGERAALEAFRKAITGPEDRSDAKEVLLSEELPANESLKDFRIRRGDPQIEALERLDAGEVALTHLAQVTQDGFSSLETKLGAKMDQGFSSPGSSLGAKMDLSLNETRKGLRAMVDSSERLHRDLSQRFDRVDAAYGTIGKRLARIDRTSRSSRELRSP